MAKKRLSLKELQTTQLTKEQELNTKGGYITFSDKFRWTSGQQTSKGTLIIEDDVDIRSSSPYNGNTMNG